MCVKKAKTMICPNVFQKEKKLLGQKKTPNKSMSAPLPKALALAQILAKLPSSALGLSLIRIVCTNQLMKKRKNVGKSNENSEK